MANFYCEENTEINRIIWPGLKIDRRIVIWVSAIWSSHSFFTTSSEVRRSEVAEGCSALHCHLVSLLSIWSVSSLYSITSNLFSRMLEGNPHSVCCSRHISFFTAYKCENQWLASLCISFCDISSMSAEILVRARNRDASCEVVCDPAEGFEMLKSQLFFFFEDLDFALLDYAGSKNTSTEDDLSTNINWSPCNLANVFRWVMAFECPCLPRINRVYLRH